MSGMQFTDLASQVVSAAQEFAVQYAHSQLQPLHLAQALIEPPHGDLSYQPGTAHQSLFIQAIEQARGEPQSFTMAVKRALVRLPSQDPPPDKVSVSPSLAKVFRAAHDLSKSQDSSHVEVHHLIQAVVQDGVVQRYLTDANVPKTSLIDEALRRLRRAEASAYLTKFAVDLLHMVRQGEIDPVLGCEEEVRRVIVTLSRLSRNNPILISEPGVERAAAVNELALRIGRGDVPAHLIGAKLLSLSVVSIATGSESGSGFEQMKAVIKEIESSSEEVIVFIDEFQLLLSIRQSDQSSLTALDLLTPILAKSHLHCIGATTREHMKSIEKHTAFERHFSQILVTEPSVPEATTILRGLKEKYEVYHGVTILDEAVVTAVTLAAQHKAQGHLPGTAKDLIDEAAATARVAMESPPEAVQDLERKLSHLRIEIQALTREEAEGPQARLREAKVEEADILEELQPLKEAYHGDRANEEEIQRAKMRLEHFMAKLAVADRENDYTTAADIKYYAIPDTEHAIKELQGRRSGIGGQSGREARVDVVGAEHIRRVVNLWTGKPTLRVENEESGSEDLY